MKFFSIVFFVVVFSAPVFGGQAEETAILPADLEAALAAFEEKVAEADRAIPDSAEYRRLTDESLGCYADVIIAFIENALEMSDEQDSAYQRRLGQIRARLLQVLLKAPPRSRPPSTQVV